jgi:hypothetical protein
MILQKYFATKGINIGEDISVCIKLMLNREDAKIMLEKKGMFFNENAKGYLITAYRDAYTYTNNNKREVNVNINEVDKNSASIKIIRNEKECFISNNLNSLGDNYITQNTNREYNACMVVPIRYIDNDSKCCIQFGMLAADSLNLQNEELFDKNECLHLFGYFADLLAMFLLTLEITKRSEIRDESS